MKSVNALSSRSSAACANEDGDCRIVPETAAVAAQVEGLYEDVFGSERFTKASHRFRDGIGKVRELSCVALDSTRLIGVIRYWPVRVGEEDTPALLLGPLAVARDRAGRGVGTMLMVQTLNLAARLGHSLVLLVGDHAYYRRFGFQPAAPLGFVMPGETRPERLQVLPLKARVLGHCSGQISRANPMSATILPWPIPQPC